MSDYHQFLKDASSKQDFLATFIVENQIEDIDNVFAFPIEYSEMTNGVPVLRYISTFIYIHGSHLSDSCFLIQPVTEEEEDELRSENHHLWQLFHATIDRHNNRVEEQSYIVVNKPLDEYVWHDYPPAQYSAFGQDMEVVDDFEEFRNYELHFGDEEEIEERLQTSKKFHSREGNPLIFHHDWRIGKFLIYEKLSGIYENGKRQSYDVNVLLSWNELDSCFDNLRQEFKTVNSSLNSGDFLNQDYLDSKLYRAGFQDGELINPKELVKTFYRDMLPKMSYYSFYQ